MNKEAAKVLIAKGKEEIKAFNSAFQIPTYICPQCGECRMQQDSTVGLVATCPPILEAVSFSCNHCGFRYVVTMDSCIED